MRKRLALFAALLVSTALRVAAAAPPPPEAQVGVVEFHLDGDEASPALAGQLEQSLLATLTSAGVVVLDSVDVARRLADTPELLRCETPICLKQLGQRLGVGHVVRVRVNVTGNSYKFAGRIFSTVGPTATGLPVESQSRFCDVCTVAEARETMGRLAEALRRPVELPAPVAEAPAPPPAPPPPPGKLRWVGLALGVATVAAGVALLSQRDTRGGAALAGGLMGVGASATAVSLYVILDRTPRATGGGTQATAGLSARF